MILSVKNKKKNKIEKALCFVITILMVKNILFVNPFTQPFQGYINNLIAILIVIIFLTTIKELSKKIPGTLILVAFVCCLFILTQLLIFPRNNPFFLEHIPRIVFFGIIPFLFMMAVNDYKLLIRILRRCSYLIIGTAVISVILLYISGSLQSDYYMSFGDCAIIGVIIIEHYVLKEKKWFDIVMFLVGSLSILLAGSRGPFLGVICYFILHILLISNHRKFKIIVLDAIVIAIGFLLYSQLINIITALGNILAKVGINSRTMMLILSGEVASHDSGRSIVYGYVLDLIKEYPLLGIGYDGMMGLGYTDLTPHSTFLEFLLYYGVIVGSICVICLTILWINGIFRNQRSIIHYLCVIFFSIYVPRSFIGAGGIEAPAFWLLLATSIVSIIQSPTHFKVKIKGISLRKDKCRINDAIH